MMRSEGKITRENAFEIIKQFAKEYRKELGKVPGEIIDEQMTGGRVVSYIEDGVNINARNVDDVIARIKEKMKQ